MYYEVYVASQRYQKREPLTYSFDESLKRGDVIEVPLGKNTVVAVVVRLTKKPDFVTKPIYKKIESAGIPDELIGLTEWLSDYYACGIGPVTNLMLPASLKNLKRINIAEDKGDISLQNLPKLTDEQQSALEQINQSKRSLLHGETGTGKTRLYLEKAIETFQNGQSVLILTPEISLTPQLEETFRSVFGEKTIVLHSNLTVKNRREAWQKISQSNSPLVVIGPRSALFSPLKNIGFVAVDEFHEPAYKQEQGPRYNALRVAGKLAQLHADATIVYGSATPSITEYYLAELTKMPIIRLTKPAKGSVGKIKTEIVDLKDKNSFAKNRFISDQLISSISDAITNNEQSLVYLNRRGTARLVLCQDCGWQALCPRCDLPLTYHGDSHHIRCHTCGYSAKPPLSCPKCHSHDIQYRTIGTKAVVEALENLFPQAKILRFDTDLGVNDRLDKHYEDIKAGKVDILVGTQLLGKGLDLPKLSVVGVLAADSNLSLPDFSSSERGYQLLHQVMGRVGRGHSLKSELNKVILQTYMPNSQVIASAVKKDWLGFYKSELDERQKFMFPPFCYLLKITVSRKTSSSAQKTAEKLHEALQASKIQANLSDPAPSFYEKSFGMYHWQLVLKSKDRNQLIKALESIKAAKINGYTFDLDPINLL